MSMYKEKKIFCSKKGKIFFRLHKQICIPYVLHKQNVFYVDASKMYGSVVKSH